VGIKISGVLLELLNEQSGGPKKYVPIALLVEPSPTEFILSNKPDEIIKADISLSEDDFKSLEKKEKKEKYTFKVKNKVGELIFTIEYKELYKQEYGTLVIAKSQPYNITILKNDFETEEEEGDKEKESEEGPDIKIPEDFLKGNRNMQLAYLAKNFLPDGKSLWDGLSLKEGTVLPSGFFDAALNQGKYDPETYLKVYYNKLKEEGSLTKKIKENTWLNLVRKKENLGLITWIRNTRKNIGGFFNNLKKEFPTFEIGERNVIKRKKTEESVLNKKNLITEINLGKSASEAGFNERVLFKNLPQFMEMLSKMYQDIKGQDLPYNKQAVFDFCKEYGCKVPKKSGPPPLPKKENLEFNKSLNLLLEQRNNQRLTITFTKIQPKKSGDYPDIFDDIEIDPETGKYIIKGDMSLEDFAESAFYLYGYDVGRFFPKLSSKFKDIPQLFGLFGRGGLDKRFRKRLEKLGLYLSDITNITDPRGKGFKIGNYPVYELEFTREIEYNKDGVYFLIKVGDKLPFSYDQKNRELIHNTSYPKYKKLNAKITINFNDRIAVDPKTKENLEKTKKYKEKIKSIEQKNEPKVEPNNLEVEFKITKQIK
jgi:hypothetical protein